MNPDRHFQELISQGICASRDMRMQDALSLFARASTLAPDSEIPHLLMGSEHAAAGNVALAEAEFAQAVLRAPTFWLARYQLGLLQFSDARAAVALLTWQPLLALPETEALVHFVRGFAELAQGGFAQALAHFESGLACSALNPEVAKDVMKVVEAVRRLQGACTPTQAGHEESHVLLSAYARSLH